MIKTLLFIGFGSFLGGISRYLLSKFVQETILRAYPWGTLAVNLLGCFALGLFCGMMERGNFMNLNLRMFFMVGFCGSFTTYSTFMNENFQLLRDGNIIPFLSYLAFSLLGGFLFLGAGYLIAKLY